jgi:hypothetical protein
MHDSLELSKKKTKKDPKKQYPESVCASRKLSGALKSGSPSATAHRTPINYHHYHYQYQY